MSTTTTRMSAVRFWLCCRSTDSWHREESTGQCTERRFGHPGPKRPHYARARDTPCLPSPTCLNAQGYGHIRYQGRIVRANRLAYVLSHGLTLADIRGVVIRHTCDNPACINPDHLERGTHTDNMRDMHARGRNRQPKGEANAKAKLTADQVREIRAHVAAGNDCGYIADVFGVDRSVVCRIVNRKIWSHVQ